jgi:hypothetical protein
MAGKMLDNKINKKNALEVISELEQQKCKVILPCEPEQFREFVSNLLKSSSVKMAGQKEGIFDVDRQQFENIFLLIDQRIIQQNQGMLVDFSITVFYNDGFSIQHDSIDSFRKFNQTSNCYPEKILLLTNYLVTFPKKEAPEKQVITVELDTKIMRFPYKIIRGLYKYKIESTDITWGTDMSNLLQKQGEKIMETPRFSLMNRVYGASFNAHDIIANIILIITSSFLTYRSYVLTNAKNSNIDQLKFSINAIGIFMILYFVVSIIKRITWMKSGYFSDSAKQSFIILHEFDKKYREIEGKKMKKNSFYIILSWIAGVIGSIVASYIYAFLSS